jgi:hypothetical protein
MYVNMRLKSVLKKRNYGVIALDYIHTPRNLVDPTQRVYHVM